MVGYGSWCLSIPNRQVKSPEEIPGGLSSANRKLRLSGPITILGSSPSFNSTGDSILPAQVALAQDNVFEGNLQSSPLLHDYHCFLFINSFHHSDSTPEQCHAVTRFQRALLSTSAGGISGRFAVVWNR